MRRPLLWDEPTPDVVAARIRRYVSERLGPEVVQGDELPPVPLADAREFVARSEGYESWAALVEHIHS